MIFEPIVGQVLTGDDGGVWGLEYAEHFNRETTGKVRLLQRREPHKKYTVPIWTEKREEPSMQVTYNGFAGELVKLEQKKIYRKYGDVSSRTPETVYDISIYDDEKRVTHSFADVEMKDLTFLGGVVTFCG